MINYYCYRALWFSTVISSHSLNCRHSLTWGRRTAWLLKSGSRWLVKRKGSGKYKQMADGGESTHFGTKLKEFWATCKNVHVRLITVTMAYFCLCTVSAYMYIHNWYAYTYGWYVIYGFCYIFISETTTSPLYILVFVFVFVWLWLGWCDWAEKFGVNVTFNDRYSEWL